MARRVWRNAWPKFKPLTTVVVPVLNEADNILPLVVRIQKTLGKRPAEVLFIDDSRDNLTELAIKVAMLGYNSKTFIVRFYHRTNDTRWGSLSGAVVDGIKRARSEQIIVMDGDLQHPPETIPSMILASVDYDMVVASRYREGGSADGLSNAVRHMVSRGSTLVAKIFFPLRLRHVSDPMTGFFLINRKLLDANKLRPRGFKILLEILVSHPKLAVTEVPLQFAKRGAGESHGNLKQGLDFISQLAGLRVVSYTKQLYSLPKFVLFSSIGGSVFIFGMLLLYVLVDKFGWSPLAANALQLIVTFGLNYILNKRLTWHERRIARTAANKFFMARAATTALSYLLFAWLISVHLSFSVVSLPINFSINYIEANVICLFTITVVNYVLSDRWAFAEKTKKDISDTQLSRFPHGKFIMILVLLTAILTAERYSVGLTFAIALAVAGLALFAQASVEVRRIIYAYRVPDAVDRMKFPEPGRSQEHFCLIVPARHEASVLGSTLLQLAKQSHSSVEIISVICDDDDETLKVAYGVAANEPRISVMQYPLQSNVKPSKPKQLNFALSHIADKDFTVVGVFDAEDTVHPELLRHIDAAFRDRSISIVQGGVQLMNYDSSWYALHNVLEYYRWFNSAMAYQADKKFMPLGGNTVFVRYNLLREAGGWPVTLTEDCSLGVLLSTRFQAKTAVYYDPILATQEETPNSLGGLFRQRVRWNQGFYNEWRRGLWHELPSFRQRILAGYVLFSPILLASITSFLLLTLLATIYLNAPVGLVMLMYFPLIPVSLLMVLNAVFLDDFGKAFQRKIRLTDYVKLFATYLPYQVLLNVAAFWSIIRETRGETSWYKTSHTGRHRLMPAYDTGDSYAFPTISGDSL